MDCRLLIHVSLYVLALMMLAGAFITFMHGLFLGLQVDPNLGNAYVLAAFTGFLAASATAGLNTWWLVKSRKKQ